MKHAEDRQEESLSAKWEKKKISIAGFTENLRKEELKKKTKKMAEKGWELFEYVDDGMTKSYALFQRQLTDSVSSTPGKSWTPWRELSVGGKIWRICWIWLVIGMIGSFLTPSPYNLDDFLNKSLEQVSGIVHADSTVKGVNEYLKKNNLPNSLSPEFVVFLSHNVFQKNKNLKVGTVLDWGKNEVQQNGGHFKGTYYDLDRINSQFSGWDGSHHKLVSLVKANMNDEESFEHVKTLYGLVLHGKESPYMNVSMIYSGKNAFGARIKERIAAKVNIDDGTILEILN